MNSVGEAVSRFTAAGAISATAAAFWYRPVPNEGGRDDAPLRSGYVSRINFSDHSDRAPPYLLSVARNITVSIVVSASSALLNYGGIFRLKIDDNYEKFTEVLVSRPRRVPLITVSNHRSVMDEPVLLASILPLRIGIQPRYLRWSICTQDICFQNGALLAAFFGAGKTLPIVRGHGINQKLLLDFARHIAAGDWCHVFPEGGCWQSSSLGGARSDSTEHINGRLKWGVGKLIAHSPVRPIVIPFYHYGMEHFVPQDEKRKILVKFPIFGGHKVTARVGEEIKFDDLIEKHEEKYGKLWKYNASIDDDENPEDFHSSWDSKETDLILYQQITLRIEKALVILNDKCRHDFEEVKRTGDLPLE